MKLNGNVHILKVQPDACERLRLSQQQKRSYLLLFMCQTKSFSLLKMLRVCSEQFDLFQLCTIMQSHFSTSIVLISKHSTGVRLLREVMCHCAQRCQEHALYIESKGNYFTD